MGVETGGCPHTAIREDASINLAAVDEMRQRFPALDLILIESGGDNLAATFSPELADLTIYVIDVAGGEKIPRKGGPGITRSDLLVINKIDLAPYVGASLEVMARDAERMRKGAAVRHGQHEDRQFRENVQKDIATTVALFPYARRSPAVLMRLNPGQGVAALDPAAGSRILAPVSRPDGRRLRAEESPGSMRTRRRITSGESDLRDSATESKPPAFGRQG